MAALSEPAGLVALGHVAAQARGQAGAENFPVALRVLPRRPRTRLLALYDYARFVDDVGDAAYDVDGHPVTTADRLVLLDVVEAELDRDGSDLAPVAALRPMLDEGVPVQPFRDLVAANRQDQHVHTYATFADLVGYCRLSADPVGRVVLHIAGRATAERIAWSDEVCTALQLLEHAQDVAEDARAGRVYLPQADLDGRSTAQAVAGLVERAEFRLRHGPDLVHSLSGWARVAVAGFVAGGLATAEALREADPADEHVRPGRVATARHAVRLAVGR